MPETTSEKFKIRLHVYDEDIFVTIDRSDEKYYRDAAVLISERFGAYNQAFKGLKSEHTIALMTLVEIALRYEKELSRNDTHPYDKVLSKLTSEIEEALKE